MANTIKVLLTGDSKGLNSTLSTSQRRISQFGLVATAALGALAVSSVKAASDSKEAANAVEVTFGKAADGILKLSETASDSYNLSASEFDKMAVSFANFATNVAGDGGDVVGVIDDLTQRAADFASVYDLQATEAARLFQSTLAGQSRPLRQYGIDVSAAAVSAFAYANGIAKVGQELTEQQKVQARYGLLMKETQKDEGDLANTADSLANRTRHLAAEWDNAKSALGEGLLPMVEKMVGAAQAMLTLWQKIPAPFQSVILVMGLLGAAMLAIVPRVLAMRAAMVQANVTMASMRASTMSAVAGFGPWGLALAAATVALLAYQQKQQAVQARTAEYTATLDENTGALTKNTTAAIAKRLEDQGLLEQLSDEGLAIEDLTRVIQEGVPATQEYIDAHGDVFLQAGKGMNVINGQAAALLKEAGSLQSAQESYERTTTATEAHTDATKMSADEVADLTDKVEKLTDKFTILRDGFLDSKAATRGYEAALDDARKALKENGKTLDKHTVAGRANQEALENIARTGNDVITSMVKQGKSADEVTAKYNKVRGSLVDQARQFGMTKAEAEKYVSQILKTPKEVTTRVKAVTDKQEVLDYQRLLRQTPNLVLTQFQASYGVAGRQGDQRAQGGYIAGPGSATSDSIPAWLSNGEYVIRASAVNKVGVGFLNAINSGHFGAFASGGSVGGDKPTITKGTERFLQRLDDLVKAARDQLKELRGQRRDFAKGVSQGLMGGMSLGGTIRDNRDNDAGSLLSRFKQQANRIKSFIRNVSKLQKKGLNRALTMELLDMGSEEGLPLSRILLTEPALLNKFNKVYRGIDNASDRLGNRLGNEYYGDRINKAEKRLRQTRRVRDRADRIQEHNINVEVKVLGHALASDKQLAKAFTPAIREELRKIQRRNR